MLTWILHKTFQFVIDYLYKLLLCLGIKRHNIATCFEILFHVSFLYILQCNFPPTIHEISVTIYPLSVGMLICRPYRLPASCLGLWNQHNNRSKPVAIVGHRMGLPQSKKRGTPTRGTKFMRHSLKNFVYILCVCFFRVSGQYFWDSRLRTVVPVPLCQTVCTGW